MSYNLCVIAFLEISIDVFETNVFVFYAFNIFFISFENDVIDGISTLMTVCSPYP